MPQEPNKQSPQSNPGGTSNPSRSQTNIPGKAGPPPRYDDRPDTEGDVDTTGGQTETRPGQSTPGKTGTGPGYGDREPGDPRRIDIEGTR